MAFETYKACNDVNPETAYQNLSLCRDALQPTIDALAFQVGQSLNDSDILLNKVIAVINKWIARLLKNGNKILDFPTSAVITTALSQVGEQNAQLTGLLSSLAFTPRPPYAAGTKPIDTPPLPEQIGYTDQPRPVPYEQADSSTVPHQQQSPTKPVVHYQPGTLPQYPPASPKPPQGIVSGYTGYVQPIPPVPPKPKPGFIGGYTDDQQPFPPQPPSQDIPAEPITPVVPKPVVPKPVPKPSQLPQQQYQPTLQHPSQHDDVCSRFGCAVVPVFQDRQIQLVPLSSFGNSSPSVVVTDVLQPVPVDETGEPDWIEDSDELPTDIGSEETPLYDDYDSIPLGSYDQSQFVSIPYPGGMILVPKPKPDSNSVYHSATILQLASELPVPREES